MAHQKSSAIKTQIDLELKLTRILVLTMLGVSFTVFGLAIAIGWLSIVYVNNPLTSRTSTPVSVLSEVPTPPLPFEVSTNYWNEIRAIHAEVFAPLRGSDLLSGGQEEWDSFALALRSGAGRILKLTLPSEDRAFHLSLVLFYEQTIEEIKNEGEVASIEQANALRLRLMLRLNDVEQANAKLINPSLL